MRVFGVGLNAAQRRWLKSEHRGKVPPLTSLAWCLVFGVERVPELWKLRGAANVLLSENDEKNMARGLLYPT